MAVEKWFSRFQEKWAAFLATYVVVEFIFYLIVIAWMLFLIIAFVPILWIEIVVAVIATFLYGMLSYGLFKSLRHKQKSEGSG
jgi:hypothetical protein